MKFDWIREARFASWWMTWEDLEWPDYEIEKKWETRAKIFSENGVNAVVIFGFHFRWDYLPILDRVIEILARITEICHNAGLRVVDHHSATFVHRVRNVNDRWEIRKRNRHHVPFYPDNWQDLNFNGSKLSDWQQISARDNQPVYYEGYNNACFCPNNPDYQKAYLEFIARHLEKIKYDALMSDDLQFMPDIYTCSCSHCREKFYNATKMELPDQSEKDFWENYKNTYLQEWIQLRYQWTAEHYKRLRAFLPENIALWGCASNCIGANLADMGVSPPHYAFYWDAVFHEINHSYHPVNDRDIIRAGISAFASIARQHNKPLIAVFYVKKLEDIKLWTSLIEQNNARPWLSRQVRTEDAIPEEKLLLNGIYSNKSNVPSEMAPLVSLRFSQKYRDSLPRHLAEQYVDSYMKQCNSLITKNYTVDVIFDGYKKRTKTEEEIRSINS
jgi:hypothetical protein